MYNESGQVHQSLCAGACGYIPKSANDLELLSAIDQVVESRVPTDNVTARKVIAWFLHYADSFLSKRETDVLCTKRSAGFAMVQPAMVSPFG